MHIWDWISDVCSSDLVGPPAEGIVRIEARAAAIAALRIQHHAIGDERIALPFIPEPRAAARDIGRVAALEHHALDRRVAGAGAPVPQFRETERTSAEWGQWVSRRVKQGGGRTIKKKK